MELICTSCFINPVAAHRNAAHDPAEILVCNLGAASVPQGMPAHEDLRCSHCGSTVHLSHHHTAWYDV
jgi:hypothetical protein